MDKPQLESVAKALIINRNDEVLVLTIGEHKASPEKSYRPDLPGGLVDPGETEREAVLREMMEETGISADSSMTTLACSNTEFYKHENKSVSKHLFIVKLKDNPQVQLSWEHIRYEWIPLNSLKKIEFRSFYKAAIEYCFDKNIISVIS